MKHLTIVVLFAVFTVLAAQRVSNGPQASVTMASLVPKADAIVVATVLHTNVTDASVMLNVEEVLKGGLQPRTQLIASWQPVSYNLPVSPPTAVTRGLFFLQSSGPGSWTIIPCTSGRITFNSTFLYVPDEERPQEFVPRTRNELDAVLLTVAWAKQAGVPPGGATVDLVGEYRKSRSAALKSVLNGFAQSPSPMLSAIGLQALLFEGDVNALQRVEAEQSTLLRSGSSAKITDEIKFYFLNTDRTAVSILGRLATSPTTVTSLKEAAAGALARLHTKEALPYLAGLLSSPSFVLRTYAVGGFAMFANNIQTETHHLVPGPWRYRTEETLAHSAMDAANADFWRAWWLANQADVLQVIRLTR